jgi:thioredoxin reductase (NADPH)
MKKYDVVIVGGGMAGISAAIWCSRLNVKHLLLESSDTLGGQLEQIHNKLIDYPGILVDNGKQFQKLLIEHVDSLQCNIKSKCLVKKVDSLHNLIHLSVEGMEKQIQYNYLIAAMGSKSRTLDIPGEQEMIFRGEVYSTTSHKDQFANKTVAIVGGGDRAFEGALNLANAGANVILIHRSENFRARSQYKNEVLQNKNIQLLTNTTVTKIVGEDSVHGIEVNQQGNKRRIDVSAVIPRIGTVPNTSLIQDLVNLEEGGQVAINEYCQTNIPTIFAIGDICNPPEYTSLSTSAAQGMIAAKRISELLHKIT